MDAPLVIRRALGSPRDVERVATTLRGHGEPVGDHLAASLRSDRWGVVLLAERAGATQGLLVLRFLHAVGAAGDDPPVRALVDGLWCDDGVVRVALLSAARAEAEGRELAWRADDAPTVVPAAVAPDAPTAVIPLRVAQDVSLAFTPGERGPRMVTRWSGATAFRARRGDDLARVAWSVDGCVGADDDDGDGLRFDPAGRALREVYLHRPTRVRADEALLSRVRALAPREGVLRLPEAVSTFTLPRARFALFDVSLDVLAAFTDAPGEGELQAVALTDALALLFLDGAYVGWRVHDPVSQARPMGWPDVQESRAPAQRDALAALVHDWMAIDATTRPRPDEVTDEEEIAHMTALRDRARTLAAQGDGSDPGAGVARDIGAHIHWSWGFFRVGEG